MAYVPLLFTPAHRQSYSPPVETHQNNGSAAWRASEDNSILENGRGVSSGCNFTLELKSSYGDVAYSGYFAILDAEDGGLDSGAQCPSGRPKDIADCKCIRCRAAGDPSSSRLLTLVRPTDLYGDFRALALRFQYVHPSVFQLDLEPCYKV